MKKLLCILVSVGGMLQGATTDSGSIQHASSPRYASSDPAVNALFDFFRKLYSEPAVNAHAQYLQEGLITAQRNFTRDVQLSREMITHLGKGLERFNADVAGEVTRAAELRTLLVAVVNSFERRMRAIDQAQRGKGKQA